MPKLDFIPDRDGFHFANDFVNYVLNGPINIVTKGRCGGMAAGSIDYYRNRIPIPTHPTGDLPNGIPAEGSRLSQFIYDRLVSTIIRPEGAKFILGPWVTNADCFRWSLNDEFPKLKRRVDAGQLSVVGLWSQNDGLGGGHQVVCYGYDMNPPTLWVYDNNYPDVECRLVGVSENNGVRSVYGNGNADFNAYRGYFFHDIIDYNTAAPMPPYVDLAVSAGVTVEPFEDVVQGQRLACTVTVRNYGEYPAHLRGLILFLRGPSGENLDPLLGGLAENANSLQPGEERVLRRENAAFQVPVGIYVVGASYLSEHNHWRVLPPGAGADVAVQRQFRVVRADLQLAIDRQIDVPESAADVDTGIDLSPGDEISLEATGTIWAGVWLTDRNGPAGWSNVDHDPKFPLHVGADAHPYALLARYGGLGYFLVGDRRLRGPYDGGTRRRLFLRINDDMPGNGNGSFNCRVRIWR